MDVEKGRETDRELERERTERDIFIYKYKYICVVFGGLLSFKIFFNNILCFSLSGLCRCQGKGKKHIYMPHNDDLIPYLAEL